MNQTINEPKCGECGEDKAIHHELGCGLYSPAPDAETVEAVKTELLPCPFCGQAEVGIRAVRGRFHLRKGDDPEYQAICRECLATSAPQASIGIARTAWNTRTDAALTDRVRELGRASERYRSLGDAMVKWISDLPNNIKEALPREHVLRLSEIRQAALAKEAHGE